jgi:D-glycero-alpha-D-manno-heptose-7-phosphate kinase
MTALLYPKAASSELTVVRGRAPLRISFAGGGTDVPPYPERFGGCVLSTTIDKYAYVSVRDIEGDFVRAISEDQGVDATFMPGSSPAFGGKMDLAEAIVRRFAVRGLECHINSDAPPGSGLGSSSTMIVALIEAMSHRGAIPLTKYEKAELAFDVERNDLGIVGGMQDQYAAAFGGFNFIEFDRSGVCVTPIRLTQDTVAELHMHLMLCYTGATRFSGNILTEQTSNVRREDPIVMQSLSALKDLTMSLKAALLRGRLGDFGDILNETWRMKRKLASSITNERLDETYDAARAAGALGGKLLGAGGGGHLLLFVPFNRRRRVREAMQQCGMTMVDFQFEERGSCSWLSSGKTWI